MELKKHTATNHAKVEVHTDNDAVAQIAFDFYDKLDNLSLSFECPFCGTDDDWDSLCYEIEGDNFEDTYVCDKCDAMITIISPKDAGEYHNTYPSEVTYVIEFMWGGEPSHWGEEEAEPDDTLSFIDRCPQCYDAPDYYECAYCGKKATPPILSDDQPKLF